MSETSSLFLSTRQKPNGVINTHLRFSSSSQVWSDFFSYPSHLTLYFIVPYFPSCLVFPGYIPVVVLTSASTAWEMIFSTINLGVRMISTRLVLSRNTAPCSRRHVSRIMISKSRKITYSSSSRSSSSSFSSFSSFSSPASSSPFPTSPFTISSISSSSTLSSASFRLRDAFLARRVGSGTATSSSPTSDCSSSLIA